MAVICGLSVRVQLWTQTARGRQKHAQLTGDRGWTGMAMTVVNWTSAVRSMAYAMAVEAKGGYSARMPIAGPGLVVVQAGEPGPHSGHGGSVDTPRAQQPHLT